MVQMLLPALLVDLYDFWEVSGNLNVGAYHFSLSAFTVFCVCLDINYLLAVFCWTYHLLLCRLKITVISKTFSSVTFEELFGFIFCSCH